MTLQRLAMMSYQPDSEDEVEAKLDLVSPSKPMALYSLYKMASDVCTHCFVVLPLSSLVRKSWTLQAARVSSSVDVHRLLCLRVANLS